MLVKPTTSANMPLVPGSDQPSQYIITRRLYFGLRLPNLTDTTLHMLATDEKEKQIFAEQFQKDWDSFLLLRAKELAPGTRRLTASFILSVTRYGTLNYCITSALVFDRFKKIIIMHLFL